LVLIVFFISGACQKTAMDAIRIQAKFLIAASTRILHPGQIVIRHGHIEQVTASVRETADIDLGEAVLIPGLINSHTHLEFSHLQTPLPAGNSFPAWIAAVIADRQEQRRGQASLLTGLRECFSTGTALIADIVSYPWSPRLLPAARSIPSHNYGSDGLASLDARHSQSDAGWRSHLVSLGYPRIIPFAEVIGLTDHRLDSSLNWAQQLWQQQVRHRLVEYYAMSPHAPYSLSASTVSSRMAELPPAIPFAMHIAESTDELQWLDSGSGAFRTAYDSLGIPTTLARPSIDDCIDLLATRERSLLIHGNYLTRAQIGRLSQIRGLSVVYCPRTHRHFGHAPYPLAELTAAGVRVVFGTDSRASNPTLSIWDEMLAARMRHSFLSPEAGLDAITRDAALALGLDQKYGALEAGKVALSAVLPARSHWTVHNLLESLTSQSSAELDIRPLVAAFPLNEQLALQDLASD
jgi:cytosine/adenosine deaminase-related metal-dependent hydrolase